MDDDTHKPSFKDKIKRFLCFSCCFTVDRRETLHSASTSSTSDNTKRPLYLIAASSQWIKSRATVDLPEIKYKCSNVLGRIKNHRRRRRSSTDFRYDPLSYALNFEDDSSGNVENNAPVNSFSSRLPSSPPSADLQKFLSTAAVS
ncbi:hypothetical protein QVD17_00419 [Tagetes erecta]|uniref:Uncharacterized protein n=1 Tax=Tagetes erecta TaxID=13708 RepID=A0AAD8P0L0_TARER|nr:hypothetical protein QVD17_00419 [Tagetes erecta]